MKTTTEGHRIYVIGDVHGRDDLLREMFQRIQSDLKRRPHESPRLIMLGDYVDRGPNSRGVIDMLIELKRSDMASTFLLGNHDSYVEAYLDEPEWFDRSLHWLNPRMGGDMTLLSYGVPDANEYDPEATRDAFADALPEEHLDFIRACDLYCQIGSYVFVHAGIRPGVPLERQLKDDLIWIREPFLSSIRDFGFKVVHGHTIVKAPEHHTNRIAIDTGAYASDSLTCLVLEDAQTALLSPDGPVPFREQNSGVTQTLVSGLRGIFGRA